MTEEKKVIRRTQRSSRISTIVSISLVLFLLGVLSILLLHAQRLSYYVRENVEISLIINPDSDPAKVERLVNSIRSDALVKEANLISKDLAAEVMKKELGDDFVGFLGFNPLYASIDVHLKGEFADEDSFKKFVRSVETNPIVSEVYYQPSLIESMNRNLRTIAWVLLTFSGLLVLVSITLINNTIRITLYSRRLLIKSMLLVGATKGFIRRPYLMSSLWNGLAGGVIALVFIAALVHFVSDRIPELALISDFDLLGIAAGILLGSGVILSLLCTWFAVNRYLRYRTETIY
jgi:cell division transport system permease protein